MFSETYTISTSQCLVTSAKRYRSSNRRVHAGTAGWVLIFAHGAGMFKERFEPLLRRLFQLDERKECGAQIVEAWTVDAQTHGTAAELNESVINQENFRLTAFDYAGALAALRTSIFFGDADMQRVVLIGENEGSSTVLFTPDFFSPDDPLPIENIILINPFSPSPQFDTEEWRGRESARAYFRKRLDPVMADNFVHHALVRTETGTVRMRASKRHQDQLRDTKYTNWSQWSSQLALVCILY
ncbi:hypothetical protein CPB85DRAFT_800921 [Mucidula mucida]|nr:hypothetical protein CPB85DRAFT_800921 [Mucidula mucida]